MQLVHTFSGYKQVNLNVFLPVLNLLTGQHWGLPLGVLRVDVESVCVCGHGFSLVWCLDGFLHFFSFVSVLKTIASRFWENWECSIQAPLNSFWVISWAQLLAALIWSKRAKVNFLWSLKNRCALSIWYNSICVTNTLSSTPCVTTTLLRTETLAAGVLHSHNETGMLVGVVMGVKVFRFPVVVVVVAAASMNAKRVSADDYSLCSLIRSLQILNISLRRSLIALAILIGPSSMLTKVWDFHEGMEFMEFSECSRNQGVVVGIQEGVSESGWFFSVSNWVSVFDNWFQLCLVPYIQ